MTYFKQQGFVIPLALIITGILAMLAMGISHQARNQIKALQRNQAQWQTELSYRSVLQKIIHILLTEQSTYNVVQMGQKKLPIDDRVVNIDGVNVQIQDIAGLMALGTYQEPQMYRLLLQLTNLETARRVSQEFTDWIDKNNYQQRYGMEAANYSQAGLSYRPRNKMIRSLDELTELPSMTFDLYNGTTQQPGLRDLLIPGVVLNFNAATAPEQVLYAVLNPTPEQWQAIWSARSAENWRLLQKLLLDFPDTFGELGPFIPGSTYRIKMTMPNQKAMRVIIKLRYGHNPPYAIQQWYYPDDDRGQN